MRACVCECECETERELDISGEGSIALSFVHPALSTDLHYRAPKGT